MARKAFQRTQKNTSEQPCEYAPFNLKNMTHEEAIDIVRKNYSHVEVSGSQFETALRNLIPELRESEDERIRKRLIEYFEGFMLSKVNVKWEGLCVEGILAWLEKQKEYHIPWYDYQKSKEAGYTIVPNEEYEQLIKQKEQKPAEWDDADMKEARNNLISVCMDWERGKKTTLLPVAAIRARYFLEHLVKPKQPESGNSEKPNDHVEWSEKDEGMLNCIIATLCEESHGGRETNERMVSWLDKLLKSLRPQPKSIISDTDKSNLKDAPAIIRKSNHPFKENIALIIEKYL